MTAALDLSKEDEIFDACPRGNRTAGSECLNCKQALECLPFEREYLSNLAQNQDERARCFALRPEVAPVLISEQGTSAGVSGDRLEIRKAGAVLGQVRLNEISSLQLNGTIQITSQALKALSERGIPVLMCSQSGYLVAHVLKSSSRDGKARMSQIIQASDPPQSLLFAKLFVYGKVHNQLIFLRRRSGKSGTSVARLWHCLKKIRNVDSKDELRGIEGEAAKFYFDGLSRLIGKNSGFSFSSRSRRPPLDPVNAMLSFGYAVLHTEVLKGVLSAGLDPAVGFLHEIHAGRDSLVCDLVEEFRAPIVDSTVLAIINRRQVKTCEFDVTDQQGCLLQSSAKKTLITELERKFRESLRHPIFGYRVSWRRAIQIQAGLLKHSFLSEKYPWTPFFYR